MAENRFVVVLGTAQRDAPLSDPNPHAMKVDEEARRAALTGDYEYLTLNLAWRTATGRDVASGDKPDILGVRCDGRVDAWEVQSEYDRLPDLEDRLRDVMDGIPPRPAQVDPKKDPPMAYRGTIYVCPRPYTSPCEKR